MSWLTTKHCSSLLVVPVLVLLFSCQGDGGASVEDFDQVLYAPEYAKGFEIRGAQGRESTLVSVSNPWQGAEEVSQQLLIVRGEEAVPRGYEGQVLRGDAQRVVAMSSTHVAMLDAVGATDCVAGVSGRLYISNPRILARADSVGDVGYEGNIDYECLLSLAPDVVLLYGVSGASSMESKLAELGIPYIYIGDYVEECPLGKAEWMVAIAEIVGRRQAADSVFADIHLRYNALKQRVAQSAPTRPRVMLNTPYRDAWMMPSTRSYAVRLLLDAGGEYVYPQNTSTSSVPIDMEEAYLLANEAQVWLNVGMLATMHELQTLCPRFANTQCVLRGEVYNNNRRCTPAGGNDYYESGTTRPDLVLSDLVKILHPGLLDNGDLYYYKRLQ